MIFSVSHFMSQQGLLNRTPRCRKYYAAQSPRETLRKPKNVICEGVRHPSRSARQINRTDNIREIRLNSSILVPYSKFTPP
jgi:hypothetical protein